MRLLFFSWKGKKTGESERKDSWRFYPEAVILKRNRGKGGGLK